jgi:hypothetical protein
MKCKKKIGRKIGIGDNDEGLEGEPVLDIKNIKNIRKKWRIVGDHVGGAVSLQSPTDYSLLVSMVWKTHTILHSHPYHVTLYHTTSFIPYHVTLYHHTKAVTGCLGSFFKIWKLFLQAAILVHLVPSFVERFLWFLLRFSATSGGQIVNPIL